MKEKLLYNGQERGYLKYVTNNSLVRLKQAKAEYRKHFPKVLYSFASLMLGLSLIAGGVTVDLTSKPKVPENETSYLQEVKKEEISAGNLMEIFGSVITLSGLIALWKSISNKNKEWICFEGDLKLFFKIIVCESSFDDFIRKKNLNVEKFLALDTKVAASIVEEFIEVQDKVDEKLAFFTK